MCIWKKKLQDKRLSKLRKSKNRTTIFSAEFYKRKQYKCIYCYLARRVTNTIFKKCGFGFFADIIRFIMTHKKCLLIRLLQYYQTLCSRTTWKWIVLYAGCLMLRRSIRVVCDTSILRRTSYWNKQSHKKWFYKYFYPKFIINSEAQ